MREFFNFILSLKSIILFGVIGGVMLWVWNAKRLENSQSSPVIYHSVNELQFKESQWVYIENCTLDVLSSAYDMAQGSEEEILIPIITGGEPQNAAVFLQSKDTSFLNLFNQFLKLERDVNGLKLELEIMKQDQGYVEFKEMSIDEMVVKTNERIQVYNDFLQSNPPIVSSVEGIVNPKFVLNYDQAIMLNHPGSFQVIKEGKPKRNWFYMSFLFVVGGMFSLLAVFSLFGLFVKEEK